LLEDLAPSSRARTLAAIKSLLAFGQRTGYLPLNVGAALKLSARKDTLAERILSETQVQRLIALERNQRNRVLLLLLYRSGPRVSELCALRWRDLQPRDDRGEVTAFGKGGKTRVVLLPASVWRELEGLARGPADEPVFRSRRGGHLDPSAVLRIVRHAARTAGLAEDVSPHWLRHAHATHALERQAPIHLVAATLGHSSVATTGRYLHARPADSSSSAKAAAELAKQEQLESDPDVVYFLTECGQDALARAAAEAWLFGHGPTGADVYGLARPAVAA
jgi:integrase/recombinase XerD